MDPNATEPRNSDAEPDEALDAAVDGAEDEAAAAKRISQMTVPERLKAAMKGTREMRAVLVRDTNRMVALAVLSSPKLTETEVESFARLGSVSEDVLRSIGQNRAWTKSYTVISALVRNAKTPIAVSLTLLPRLLEPDVKKLSIDRNVPEPVRVAARRKLMAGGKE